jgi:hypothetical protein
MLPCLETAFGRVQTLSCPSHVPYDSHSLDPSKGVAAATACRAKHVKQLCSECLERTRRTVGLGIRTQI